MIRCSSVLALTLGAFACSDAGSKKAADNLPDGGLDASVRHVDDGSHTTSSNSSANHQSTPESANDTARTDSVHTDPFSTRTSAVNSTTGPLHTSETSPLASIKAQLSTPTAPGLELFAFRAGGASAANVDSLKYFIRSIQVCESLTPQGSGFQNPMGCLELYSGDQTTLNVDPNSDFTALGDAARAVSDGYVDLLSANDRGTLTRSTTLRPDHVRTYNYGIITWALPVKVNATITLGDGTSLFTHDGITTSEVIGSDNFRNYFTRSAVSLLTGPSDEAVVLLGNGGNWFKFQQGFEITEEDLSQGNSWVLDLVFNPDGIIKGYEATYVNANLREEDDQGIPVRGITVPMIDLVPVPHREADHVVRESYVANVDIDGNGFDLRVELYSRENDPSHSVLGVDVKTLVSARTTEPPSEATKVATVRTDDAGALRFGSFNDSQIIGDFVRLETVGDSHTATFACATHADRAGAEGGALIVVAACPAPTVEVEFRLMSRSRLDQSIPFPTVDPDAGVEPGDDPDAGAPDASPIALPDAGDASNPDAPDGAIANDAASVPELDARLDGSASMNSSTDAAVP